MAHRELFDPTRRPARIHVLVPDRFGQAYATQGHDGRWGLPHAWRNYGETPARAAVRATRQHLGLELTIARFAWVGEVGNGRQYGVDELVVVQPTLSPQELIQVGIDYNHAQDFALLGAATLEQTLHCNPNLLPKVGDALSTLAARSVTIGA